MSEDLGRYLKGLPKILATDIKGLDRSKSQYVYVKAGDAGFTPGASAEYFATDLSPDKMLAMNGLVLVAQTKAQEFAEDLRPVISGGSDRLKTWQPRNRHERRSQESYARKKTWLKQ